MRHGGDAGPHLAGQPDDEEWQAAVRRFDAYSIRNIGNYTLDDRRTKHALTEMWEGERKDLEVAGVTRIPTTIPAIGWDSLTRQPAGASAIEPRGGGVCWEQWVALAHMNQQTVTLAMFHDADEGTAVATVTDRPPIWVLCDTLEGMPSVWYLRLTREGVRMLRGKRSPSEAMPIAP